MISTFLVEHPWTVQSAFVLLVALSPFVGQMLTRRRRLALALAAVSLLPLLALTFVPTGRQLDAGCTVQWMLPTWGGVEALANVVLFAVPVLLLGAALGRPVAAFLAGTTLSALIEATQAVATVLGRSCDTTDWLANTIGSGLGALLAAVALLVARRRAPVSDARAA